MTVWMKVYDKETGKVEFDCSVNEIVKKIELANRFKGPNPQEMVKVLAEIDAESRKRPIPLCIGDGSDAYQLQIERVFILSIGKD